MKIGIYSDIHDNLEALEKALAFFKTKGITEHIFCGDFCSPIPSRVIGENGATTHCVFGNGDGDRFTIQKFATNEFPNLILYGEFAELNIEGRKIAVTHYPYYGEALALSGKYDVVLSGHTHEAHNTVINDTLWVNPGEIMGWKGSPTLAIYDCNTNTAEIVTIK